MRKSDRPKPKRGRPFTGDAPLTKKICGHFSEEDHARLFRWAEAMSDEEGTEVTAAEMVRRAVLQAMNAAGF